MRFLESQISWESSPWEQLSLVNDVVRRETLKKSFAPDEPTSSSSGNVFARSLTATHCGFCMETFIFDWWRSRQSLACKGLCIRRFCVMSWKDESEPNITYCLGTTVGLVQRFIKDENFGHD